MHNQKMENEINKRYYGLDILKIVSAFLVVFYHLGQLDFGVNNLESYVPNGNYLIYTLTAMSIPIFFMVNGSLLLNKNYDIKNILWKIFKLGLLIVVWNIVGFPSWFLKTLIVLYCIYPFLKWAMDKKRYLLYIIVVGLIIFPDVYNLLVSIAKAMVLNNINIPSISGTMVSELPRIGLFTMYSIPLFILGALQKRKNRKNSIYVNMLLLFCGVSLCLFESITITRYTLKLHDSGNGNFPTVGALMMAVGMFNMLYDIQVSFKAQKLIRFFSNNVLIVYILHSAIIRFLRRTILVDTISLVESIFISAVIYIVCTLVGTVISKIPLIKELAKI